MAELNEKELKAHIKSEEPYPVYLICGDEDYLKKFYTDSLVTKIVPAELQSFNLDRYEGKNLDLRDVFDRAEMMPMMAERRCVVVENCKLEGMNEADFSLLSTLYSVISIETRRITLTYQSHHVTSQTCQSIPLYAGQSTKSVSHAV